jgi:hypothetical protein
MAVVSDFSQLDWQKIRSPGKIGRVNEPSQSNAQVKVG